VGAVIWWTRAQQWRAAHPQVSDTVLALLVLALGLTGQPNPETRQAVPLTPAVAALLVVACAALVVRRRAPVAVWAVTLVAAAVSVAVIAGPAPAIVAVMVSVYTVATLRSVRWALLVTAVTPAVLIAAYTSSASVPWLNEATYTLAAVSAMACAIGFAVRSNRAVLAAAEERARVAEQTRDDEAQRRVTEERLRIARELHDVVAHHIAVINVQSGVARHLLDTDADAAAEALGHVREESAVVLSEMSTILGLLRGSDDAEGDQPAPGLAQVDALVDSVRRSGTTVVVRTTGAPRELAPGTDLAAYRIVQESLTNAGKHGAGSAEVAVEFRDDALVIDVANPMPEGGPTGTDGTGHGLVGMRERVAALGGRLDAGARADGRFVVHAELPVGAAS
jgi:signal transduction histidine kinase